jgi:hypothetical protein
MSDACYYLGLDLGQAADYTAITILERPAILRRIGYHPEPPAPTVYNLRHLERVTLGTSYPAIAQRVKALVGADPLRDHVTVIADATGVGVAVMDVLRAAGVKPLIPVTITGGDQVTYDKGALRVPKRDLVMALLVLFQSERLKVAAGLRLADTLRQELLAFKVEIDPQTAHDSYAAWREGAHDDLVLSAALAAWYANRAGSTRARVRAI